MSEVKQIVTAILRGDHDGNLDTIHHAIRNRNKALSNERALEASADISVGDSVRFNQQTKPAYMRGMTAVVRAKSAKSARVELVTGAGKYGPGQEINAPYSLLEVLTQAG